MSLNYCGWMSKSHSPIVESPTHLDIYIFTLTMTVMFTIQKRWLVRHDFSCRSFANVFQLIPKYAHTLPNANKNVLFLFSGYTFDYLYYQHVVLTPTSSWPIIFIIFTNNSSFILSPYFLSFSQIMEIYDFISPLNETY